MKTMVLSVAATTLLAGCLGTDNTQKIESCWSPEAKQTINSIAHSVLTEYIESVVAAQSNGEITAERKTDIASRAKVTTSDFRAVDKNKDADKLICGVSVRFTYTRPDNKQLSGDTSAEFDISRSEQGLYFSMPKAPLVAMVVSATGKD